MNVKESKIIISIFEGKSVRQVGLGPDFIEAALKDPKPGYLLKVLNKDSTKRDWYKLSDKMKLHLHVKQYVADSLGIDFGGNLDNFKWKLL